MPVYLNSSFICQFIEILLKENFENITENRLNYTYSAFFDKDKEILKCVFSKNSNGKTDVGLSSEVLSPDELLYFAERLDSKTHELLKITLSHS